MITDNQTENSKRRERLEAPLFLPEGRLFGETPFKQLVDPRSQKRKFSSVRRD